MRPGHRMTIPIYLLFTLLITFGNAKAQDFPPRYPTLELFTNTPCPICANQNPGLFNRLSNFQGEYHLVSFYPGKPYNSCIFYNANITENTARWQFYAGSIFGTPTVALNGIDFKSSNGVTNAVLESLTGQTSWLEISVEETTGSSRTVDINLKDYAGGGSLTTGRLFGVIVEREIQYNAPNGETIHHNVFRKFLTPVAGEEIDMSSGAVTKTYAYDVDQDWNADETYVIAWLMDSATKEIYNSGTRFDPAFITAVDEVSSTGVFQLRPNLTDGEFTIALSDNQHHTSVRVYNAIGSLFFSKTYEAVSEIKVDGSAWPEGTYIVRVAVDGKERSERVTIVR